ncbi:MAG: DNA replication/repair protein RecF [Clostridia bacterium]|nr:DNA replication/repair protein RecF [Clostridia bacterium]
MKVERFSCADFRNISSAEIVPHSGTNIIYGQNAQGKTNLIEGIWLFCGAKSFRCHHDNELINFAGQKAKLNMEFSAFGRSQEAEIAIENRRTASLNGVKLKSSGELCGNFCAVVFSPEHLSLVKDGPAVRRRMLDIAIGQLYPSYVAALRGYTRAVQQRNAVLKDARYDSFIYDMLENFEHEMAKFGGMIYFHRKKYMALLSKEIEGIYSSISGQREALKLEYVSTLSADSAEEAARQLEEQLKKARKEDILSGSSSVGPHREDMNFLLDGRAARIYGSQGQQRSCVLSLKLAEAQVIYHTVGEHPVMLLDDVMSELDEGRQESILNRFSDMQVFVTCCEKEQLSRLKEGKTFRMDGGVVSEE